MKRAVCLFLVLLMALGVVCAEGEERSLGSFHYRLNGDGTAVLTRYGRALGVTELEIPCTLEGSAVTAIGDRAFADCDWLTKIVVPEGVTSIGEEAFSGCEALKTVQKPASLTSVAETAFDGCDSLKKTAAEPQTEPEKHNYVLNTNTKKFHRTGCGSIKQMKDKNKKTFYGTREEVIKKGYSPCKKCNP